MQQTVTQARPYASAAFLYARAHHLLDKWADMLSDVTLLVAHKNVADYLANPKVSLQQQIDLIKEIFPDAIDQQLENFLCLLAEARQWHLLLDIVVLFKQYVADALNMETVKVYVATSLTAAQQEKLHRALAKGLQKQVKLDCSVVRELIGGAVIHTRKWVLDASVKGRLAQLKTTLMG